MGLYYKLSNGEEIEINIEINDDYERILFFKLFNGSTTFIYKLDKIISLNEIIEGIERDYKNLKIEDHQATFRAYTE